MIQIIRAVIKSILFALLCIVIVPIQTILLLFTNSTKAYILPRLWHKIVCLIFGIRVKIIGTPQTDKQTMFVSNHISYLDIPAIGSHLIASFIAKADVSGWPLFGYLSTLQQTAFISRSKKDAQHAKNALEQYIKDGKSLILFPEGTSTDGTDVRPFKSSLFSLALGHTKNGKDFWVQPFAVVLTDTNGQPVEQNGNRDIYAWYGDMDLAPHLWELAKTNGATIELRFYEPINTANYDDRKKLCKDSYEAVLQAFPNSKTKAA